MKTHQQSKPKDLYLESLLTMMQMLYLTCVWFIAEDIYDKMWLYEAKANLIPFVLDETSYFEYYIVSKNMIGCYVKIIMAPYLRLEKI